MQIIPIVYEELVPLLKLKINKDLNESFRLFLPKLMERETHYIAIDNKEILGAFSYTSDLPIGNITIHEQQYNLQDKMTFLQFIEVKPSARGKGIGKQLAHKMFEICHENKSGLRISNIVLDGMHLLNTYRQLSEQYQVNLFFYHGNHLEPQIFNAQPIEKNVFKKLLKFGMK